MLSEYEQETERDIEAWQKGDDSIAPGHQCDHVSP